MTSTTETSSAAELFATPVAENHERLPAVRGAHDPAAVVRSHPPIPAASTGGEVS